MENHAEYQAVNKNPLAPDLPEDVRALIPADIAEDLQRVRAVQRGRLLPTLAEEEGNATDWTWLIDFTHQGQHLTEQEILFIIAYAKNGFQSIQEALKECGKEQKSSKPTDPTAPDVSCLLSATVQAALSRATKHIVKGWECSLPKVHRTLFNILDSKPTDVMDVTAAGIALKNFSQIPIDKLDAIQEIHETRNPQGTQIRVRFYDKIAAATTLARLLGGFAPEKVDININIQGFETRLASALQRIGKDPDVIEGELVNEG